MEQHTKQKMSRLRIDPGIQNLVGTLWDHGYKTTQSCAGHEAEVQNHYIGNECVRTLNSNTRYISCKAGTGDGWLEKNARELGFTKFSDSALIDPETQERVPTNSFYAEEPSAEYISNEQANAYRRAA